MAIFGLVSLGVAFTAVLVSVISLLVGHFISEKNKRTANTLNRCGHIATVVSALALTFGCVLIVYCFVTGDTSIEYVVMNRTSSKSELAWLYTLSGLWSGRSGSLLFWAWLISLFNSIVAIRNFKKLEKLDNMALFVSQLVLCAFVSVLVFSTDNMPFVAMLPQYFDAAGNLTGSAQYWGMNELLEHWAMAIHPPTLFVGYAGLTIPFAYAISALIVNDPSKRWVEKSTRYTLFSWLFLGIGIGLGAVWAYVVLGWGGYWGWDSVENASLLPWLVGIALIHSFTVYRQRGIFKRWSVMCASIAFSFVILGTFITRSGLVASVHAFDEFHVSAYLFLALIVLALVASIVGLIIRWKSFAPENGGGDDLESVFSKDAAYYLNNLVMIFSAFLLGYLTLSSVLPAWLPFGGQTLSAATYNTIARPLGIIYLLILSVCPMLAWGKTDIKKFLKEAKIPAIGALVLFAVLMVYFFTYLLPSYNDMIASGGTATTELLEQGPSWYYNGLAVLGLFVASLLFFNSLFMLGRAIKRYASKNNQSVFSAAFGLLKNKASTYGGFVAHFAMSLILIGLIGSSMYVTKKSDYIEYDPVTDTALSEFVIQDFVLTHTNSTGTQDEVTRNKVYTIDLEVSKNGQNIGTVTPKIEMIATTQMRKLHAAVVSFPEEDLFVVYENVNEKGDLLLEVRVNPLISLVWIGFFLLMLGALISTFGKRKERSLSQGKTSPKESKHNQDPVEALGEKRVSVFGDEETPPIVTAETESLMEKDEKKS